MIVPSLLIRSILPGGFVSKWGKACIEMFHELCTQRLAWQTARIGPGDYLGANLESSRHHPITKIAPKPFCTHFAGWLANHANVPQLKLQETRDSGVTHPEGSIHPVRVKKKAPRGIGCEGERRAQVVKEILTNLLDVFANVPADPESRR